MSFTYALNGSNDVSIVNGALVRVYAAAEVEQRIMVTLRHMYGEYFLNLPGGVPWYELILGSKDLRTAEAVLRKIVLGVPGVVSIASFSLSFVSRKLSIDMSLVVQDLGLQQVVKIVVPADELFLDGGQFSQAPFLDTTDGGSF